MDCTSTYLSYEQTGYFSKIVLDYLAADEKLKPFFTHPVSLDGIKAAIAARKQYPGDRQLLVSRLQQQYAGVTLTNKQQLNLQQLANANSFTITTAHQPNIFTGHLYFVYKILHAIKLADELTLTVPGNNYIPVFYMGSEDADLDELGHVYLSGQKYAWETKQTGAFGRMKIDKALVKLIDTISGQLSVHPYGLPLIALLKDCYKEGATIEQASFKLVNELFAEYGLLILLPDDAELKRAFIPVVEKELTEQFSNEAVQATAALFPKTYKVQASGRAINLFYMENDLRERIVRENSVFNIQNTAVTFAETAIKDEVTAHPEKFSANVILRPVFQEMILPDIVFIGGGGEIAYWLELKKVFAAVNIPFPVLLLRNSFMIVEKEQALKAGSLGFSINDLFKDEQELLKELVKRESTIQLDLNAERETLHVFYANLKDTAGTVDSTLQQHVEALEKKALNKIAVLEKKMLRAQKKKFEAQQRQIQKLRSQLFPADGLQERIDNILPYYAKWGKDILQTIYSASRGLEQEFTVLEEQ